MAVGASLEDAGTIRDAGAVTVLYGSASGLTTTGSQVFTQAAGAVEQSDQFGSVLGVGDFNNNGFADLAAGAPQEDVGSAVDAGVVTVLYGSAGGLTASGGRTFPQVAGAVEAGDRFGFALAAGDFTNDGFVDLGAGAPLEDVGTARDAGAVSELHGSAAGLVTTSGWLHTERSFTGPQLGDQFGSALAAGDFNAGFGDFADLAVTVPFEGGASAGAVNVFYGGSDRLFATFEDLYGLADSRVLSAGHFDDDAPADLAVGRPFADSESTDVGMVGVWYGGELLGIRPIEHFSQNTPGVGGSAETGDHFGAALAAG